MERKEISVLLIEADPGEAVRVRTLLDAAPGSSFVFCTVPTLEHGLDALNRTEFALILLGDDVSRTPVLHALARVARWARFVPIVVLLREEDDAQARAVVRLGAQDALCRNGLTSGALARAVVLAIERAAFIRQMARERQMFHALLDYTPDRIYFKDLEGRYIVASRSTADFYGLGSVAEVVGRKASDFFQPNFAQMVEEDERCIRQTGESIKAKVERVEGARGRTTWVSVSKLPLRDERGRIIGIIGISRTIDALKKMEETLEAERNLLRNVIDHLPDYIFVKDREGRYTLSNLMHMRRCGVERMDQLIGRPASDFVGEKEARRFAEMDAEVIRTGRAQLEREIEIEVPGRGRVWLLSTRVPLRAASGEVQAVVCIERDITRQKENEERLVQVNADLFAALADLKNAHEEMRALQQQLVEAEKMKSIGRLAAGIAHEVKNPLAIIRMGVELLSRQASAEDALTAQVLSEIRGSVDRADAVIRGLLDYSAPQQLDLIETDLNATVEHALTLVRGELGDGGIAVELDLDRTLPLVRVDPLKISQVLVNVLINAIHAMGAAGRLAVRTRCRQVTGVGVNVGDVRSERFRAGDRVAVIEVADTGPGIPPDQLPKVFDPFFTTKPTGKGTGLGLTVAKSIIDLHGGTIEAANRPEGGAVMTITLKIQDEPKTHSRG